MTTQPDIDAAVQKTLVDLGVDYEWIEIDPEFADTAQFCEKYGYPAENSGNTIIVGSRREPKQYSACLVQASVQLDVNRTVRKLMGVRRLSFASAEETMEVTGMMIGGVTPFGLPPEIPFYVDELIMGLEYVIIGAGSRSAKVRLAPAAFERLTYAEIVPDLSRPRPEQGARAGPSKRNDDSV